jgi:demethylmacrocin O-methyltransferase
MLRDKPINLLEIGIWEGSSLKMWAEYFSVGTITGFDIDEKPQYESDKVNTFKGDQNNPFDLEDVNTAYGKFDIVVDDGSHECHHMIQSFKTLFPLLKQGGFYCIEDCLCAYDKERWGSQENIIEFIKEKIDDVHMDGIISNYEICANKKEQVKKYNANYWQKNIEWVFSSMGLVIIKKM